MLESTEVNSDSIGDMSGIDKALSVVPLVNSPSKNVKASKETGAAALKQCREYIGEASREAVWWAGLGFRDKLALLYAAGPTVKYQSLRAAAEKEWKDLSRHNRRYVLETARRICKWTRQKGV